MPSIETSIIKKLSRIKEGELFFASDFTDIGSSGAVRISLHRLEKKKIITRVAQGIYVRPKTSEYIGKVLPSMNEIAIAIAKRDKAKCIPTGAYALNAIGLSTQVPMKMVFLTDGSPRSVKIGKGSITFIKTTPKNLQTKGKISTLVIQALKEIGHGKLTEKEEEKILKVLREEKVQHLRHDIKLAPVWIKEIMKKAL
ncbi:MAG: DUF6088 family protein [Flavobacteriales bacterium]